MGASQRVAIRWIEAANVQVVIDRDKTLDVRKKWPMFNEVIVGRFDSSLALYRVFDETELKHVVSTGKITGGSYSVRPERAYGASWGHDITHVVNLGNHLRGGRLGNQIYLAKIDGFDYEFSHLGPGFDVDPAGPEEQTVTMTANKCNPGLGCSILVKTVDVDAFYKVDPSGQIHPMSQADMKQEVKNLTSKKARHLQATANVKKLKALIEVVKDNLRPLDTYFGRPRISVEEQEETAKKLGQAAKKLYDEAEFIFEDVERGARVQKTKLMRRFANFRKLVKELASIRSLEDAQKIIAKQGTKSKRAIEKLGEYAQEALAVLTFFDSEVEETAKIDNYSVTLINTGQNEWDNALFLKLQDILGETNRVLSKAGLGSATGGRVYAYPTAKLTGSSGSAGAEASYNVPKDRVSLAVLGDFKKTVHSMVHELGHRVYFKSLGGKAREEWEKFFGDNVKPPHIDAILEGWRKWKEAGADYDAQKYGDWVAYYISHLRKIGDDDTAMWLNLIVHKYDINEDYDAYTGSPKKGTTSGYDQILAKKNEIKVFLYPVSAYSGKNAEELFAEVLGYWLVYGPGKVGEIVQDVFKRVVPGMKTATISQNVAAKYVEARAIRLDKNRIQSLADDIETYLSRNTPKGPWGNRLLFQGAPYDIRAVDGTELIVYIKIQAVVTDSPFYVVSGGLGFSKGKPVVVINVNGTLDIPRNTGGLLKKQIYPVLIHELTHAADKYTKGVADRMTPEQAQNNKAYYNDPSEVRAYMQEVVDEVEARAKHLSKLQKTFGIGKGIERLLNLSPTWQEVSPYWTERNQRLVIKAVVQSLEEATTSKVAAEVLTKEWLLGVRRGWLKLMAPQITDYDDVMKAFKNLEAFVENLNDQIRYVRRAPIISIPTLSESQAFSKEVKKLEDTLDNAWSKARYWKEYIDGTAHSLKWGEDRTPDALKMLDLYKRNFDEATSGSVAIKGGEGRHRPQSLTELMDRILKILRLEAQRLKTTLEMAPESESDYTPVYKEFDLHGMKVVLNDKTISARYLEMYIKLIDRAYELLKSKGFEKVWYGTILIECEQCGGENQYGAELGVGGHYQVGPDTVHIFSRPSRDVAQLLIHELGHRWWFKHMTRANRLQFEDWIASGLVPVTVYGGKHHHEAFAEAFVWYVLEKPMTSQQLETFKLVALGKRFSAAEQVTSRYLKAKIVPVNEVFIEGLRKDVLTLMRNIPRLTDEKAYSEMKEGLLTWTTYFYSVIYERWLNNLPINLNPSIKRQLDTYVRTPAWDLYVEVKHFSVLHWWDKHDLRLWDQRVKTKARTLWKNLDSMVQEYNRIFKQQDEAKQLETEVETKEVHNFFGFDVLVKGYTGDADYEITGLDQFKDALQVYKRRAAQVMPILLKAQRPMVLDFNGGLDKGGEYFSYQNGWIMINATSGLMHKHDTKRMVKTLAHEMGHHLFGQYLSGDDIKTWTSAIYGDYEPLDLRELLAKWPEHLEWITDFIDYMAPKDPILALQTDVIFSENPKRAKREEFVDLLEKGTQKFDVPKTPITGYAGKNPEEAFCEAIGLLVAYGPRAVHEKIRRLLDLILPGQLKMASVVALRYQAQ